VPEFVRVQAGHADRLSRPVEACASEHGGAPGCATADADEDQLIRTLVSDVVGQLVGQKQWSRDVAALVTLGPPQICPFPCTTVASQPGCK
jgi:hypothetical protein